MEATNMAIWQYDLFLIPRNNLERLFGVIPQVIDRSLTEQITLITGNENNFDISHILPKTSSWSNDIIAWGDIAGDYFSILRCDNNFEIKIRIDVRSISLKFIRAIIKLSIKNNCVFLLDDMSICEPVFETLIEKIRTSEASKFVDNPQIFLQNLNDTMYDCLEYFERH
jgi:hypothetical protein